MDSNTATTMPAANSCKQKCNKKLKIATIVTSVLAICGIGFGVYGMVQSFQKDNQISDLKVQIEDSNGGVTKIETPKIETTANDGTTVTITDSVVTTENLEGYVYIGQWGKKVQIPESLETVAYTFDYNEDDGSTGLLVTGATKDGGQIIPDFSRAKKCFLGSVRRYSKQSVDSGSVPSWYGEPFMSDDNYNYYFESSQSRCTENPDYAQWEQDSWNVIKEAFSNPENYSQI